MHFFNPVHKMPLVEVVRGKLTSDAGTHTSHAHRSADPFSHLSMSVATATIFELALKLGKTPVIVRDGPGFLVNRILGTRGTNGGEMRGALGI